MSTVRSLNRHVAKLEGFKRNLLTSLQASEEVTHLGTALCIPSLRAQLPHPFTSVALDIELFV